MKLSDSEESQFYNLFMKKHGVPPGHASIRYSTWNISVWNDDDIGGIISKPRSINRELDSIWSEIKETDRNTVVKPITAELNGSHFARPILFEQKVPNLLTNNGMHNMGELSTAESTKTNTHCYVGDDNTAETVSDTDLGNELDNKEFDVDGDRETVDQQERYAMAFFRSDFASDVTLREAGIGTGATLPTDILVLRVTFADKPIGAGQTMTAQISVSHKNGTS
jgi:hypothetical protein